MRLFIFLFLLTSILFPLTLKAGKCTGSANCGACTTCNFCKHCNGGGGTCGVCGGGDKESYGKSSPDANKSHTGLYIVVALIIIWWISAFSDPGKNKRKRHY
jgi:hypothetical protein